MPFRKKLTAAYYQSEDVTGLAKDLLGKFLVTTIDGHLTSGIIVETEAYKAPEDRASHAYNHRRTDRTEVMYAAGGIAYIYFCYGMHHLMNVVTGPMGQAHAILIRALEPVEGAATMALRRKLDTNDIRLTKGPGVLSQAMGLTRRWNGTALYGVNTSVWIEDRGLRFEDHEVCTSARIGVAYAGEAANWPWRYFLKGNQYVSAHRRCL